MAEKISLFISFEGIDGSGKTTQINRLKKTLENHGISVEMIREPGGTAIGENIRDILLCKDNAAMTPVAEILLYEAARAQIVSERILPAIQSGKVVICDRFFDSTTAYQGYARGLDLDIVHHLNVWATGGLVPDITFLMDLSAHDAAERVNQRNGQTDRLEDEGVIFMEKVRQGYIDLAGKYDRIFLLDAMAPMERVSEQIERKVWEVLNT